jgi:MFS family permease
MAAGGGIGTQSPYAVAPWVANLPRSSWLPIRVQSTTRGRLIDRVGRRRWYLCAFTIAAALLLCLTLLGATSALEVMLFATFSYATIQTITLSLYLYTGELYPTRIPAIGCGTGSAWLRLGSSISPLVVAWILAGGGIDRVFLFFFLFFAATAALGAVAFLCRVDYVLRQYIPQLAEVDGVTMAECEALAAWQDSPLFDAGNAPSSPPDTIRTCDLCLRRAIPRL